MASWQKGEDAVIEMNLNDLLLGTPIDPLANTVTVTWTKPDASTVDTVLSESEDLWSAEVLFDQAGPWVPRLVVDGAVHAKRRLPTIHVGDD